MNVRVTSMMTAPCSLHDRAVPWRGVSAPLDTTRRAVRRVMRGPGCLGTIVIGILGGVLGGALFKLAGDEGINDFSLRSILIAFVGSCLLLFLANVLSPRDRR